MLAYCSLVGFRGFPVSSFGRFVFCPAPVPGYLYIAFGGELLQYRCHPVFREAELLLIFLPVFIRP